MIIRYTYSGIGIIALICTLALGCGHPSDRLLLARFQEHARDFEAIAAAVSQDVERGELHTDFILRHGSEEPGHTLQPALVGKYRTLLDRCCSKCDLFRDASSGSIMFTVSTAAYHLRGHTKGMPTLRIRLLKFFLHWTR